MERDEYIIMLIRQKKILEHQIKELQEEKQKIDKELADVPDKEFQRLKLIADGEKHYQEV